MTDRNEQLSALLKWLERVETFGLVLPDGWLGRPFDHLFAAASCVWTNNSFTIEFTDGQLLIARGPLSIELGAVSAAVSGFTLLITDLRGGRVDHEIQYFAAGGVEFVDTGLAALESNWSERFEPVAGRNI